MKRKVGRPPIVKSPIQLREIGTEKTRVFVYFTHMELACAQRKADLYTDGNLSRWVRFSSANCVPLEEDMGFDLPDPLTGANPFDIEPEEQPKSRRIVDVSDLW